MDLLKAALSMIGLVQATGLVIAVVLPLLLLATLRHPTLRIWPTPGAGSWQSYVFWPLFRGLNGLCFVAAALDRTAYFGWPWPVRALAFLALIGSVTLFVYAFRVLGRDNSYGARDGLVTDGIYRFTRNPQNAMLIVVYGCLALAADQVVTYLLCAAMMAVYVLMVLAEEPWLEGVYGDAYRRYCQDVPRFIHWPRALAAARARLGA
jgi:protein-S-isoprenylcysteine O-methyltransferase Ste14